MELTYTMRGDYRLPNLIPPESPKVGKYGMLRHSYLRKHREGLYTGMLMKGTLKAQDQMMWVQRMNNIRQAAEEIIYSQLIYA